MRARTSVGDGEHGDCCNADEGMCTCIERRPNPIFKVVICSTGIKNKAILSLTCVLLKRFCGNIILMAICKCLISTLSFSARNSTIDDRAFMMFLLNSMGPMSSNRLLYPRVYALVSGCLISLIVVLTII